MNNLIINADDLGLSESVNDAIIYCLKNGYIDRATLMVNMPSTQDAINKIISNSLQDKIGLHINLTEGRPLTTKIVNTEFCEDGLMTGRIFKTNPLSKVFLSKSYRVAIEEEMQAQIDFFKRCNFSKNLHADTHQHIHMKPSIFMLLIPILKHNSFNSMRILINIPKNGEINIFKSAFRFFMNRIIFWNHLSNVYEAGGVAAFNKHYRNNNNCINKLTETWTHPDYEENKIVDKYYEKNIIDLLSDWRN